MTVCIYIPKINLILYIKSKNKKIKKIIYNIIYTITDTKKIKNKNHRQFLSFLKVKEKELKIKNYKKRKEIQKLQQ